MDILKLFKEKGALLDGHFRLSSGLHSPAYLQCALVLMYPDIAAELGTLLAQHLQMRAGKPDCVISPAMGGIIIGHEVARAFGVPFLFAEREQENFTLRRGFHVERDARYAVVEDIITTGGSSQEVVALVDRRGAFPTAVACIVDRSGGGASVLFQGRPLTLLSLAQLSIPAYEAASCPLCREGSLPTKPGSRPQR